MDDTISYVHFVEGTAVLEPFDLVLVKSMIHLNLLCRSILVSEAYCQGGARGEGWQSEDGNL